MMPVRLVLLIGLGILVAGCSGKMRIQTDFDPDVDLTHYRTWDFLPGDPGVTENLTLDNPDVKKRIETAISDEFDARGFVRDTREPDFFVKYYLGFGEELNRRNIENYYEYMHYSVFVPRVTMSYTDVWETGTMILDVIDARARRLVWRGYAETEVNPQAGPRENGPKLKKAIGTMLDKFPPK